jgi:hypothetical protein
MSLHAAVDRTNLRESRFFASTQQLSVEICTMCGAFQRLEKIDCQRSATLKETSARVRSTTKISRQAENFQDYEARLLQIEQP